MKIYYADFQEWCVTSFLERIERIGLEVESLELERDESLAEEGYRVKVQNKTIKVAASTERGVIWALTTVVTQVQIEGEQNSVGACENPATSNIWNLPVIMRDLEITDVPAYAHRGLSLDCARQFWTVAETKKIIEAISLEKMNVLHWHLTDDQGWRIESKRFPLLTQGQEYYTQEEIREVVAYAKLRGVEVIPEIDLPGHMTALLSVYPKYSCFGKQVTMGKNRGVYPIILCPGKEETFQMLEELLDELVPLFEGPRFHLGGDEAPKTEWKKCPDCAARMEAEGLSNYEDLQGYFTKRVAAMVERHSKQVICWNETLLANNYPENVTIQYWTLQHKKQMIPFVEANKPWIFSEMFDIYLDYPYSMTPLKKVYDVKIKVAGKDVSKVPNLLGLEAAIWQEHIHEEKLLEERLFPRIFALAAVAWGKCKDYASFEKEMKEKLEHPIYKDLQFCPVEWWNPKGKARIEEAYAYFLQMTTPEEADSQGETSNDSAMNKDFVLNFITRFFHLRDLPYVAAKLLFGGKNDSKEI